MKANGGITFAQDESSAKHPSMPLAAVQDGSVDHVLRPREIARRLSDIGRHPYSHQDLPGPPAPPRIPRR